MTAEDRQTCESLITAFTECADALRRLGDAYPERHCNAVLVAANMAASYADRAAVIVGDQIASAEIAAIAMEDYPQCAA
jgi:hypothetical protein